MLKLVNSSREVRRLLDEAAVVRCVQTYLAPYLPKSALNDVVASATIETFAKVMLAIAFTSCAVGQ